MTLIIFVLTYVAVAFASKYTALGEYRWFNDLEARLVYKYPQCEEKLRMFFSFKLFHCTPCQSFWLSLPIFTFFFADPINIILSLLLYLLKTTQNDGND